MRVHTDWLLTPERAALHLPSATAIIADLHLGYHQARRRNGEAIPAAGLDHLFAALAGLAARHDVRRLVIAGDLFEETCCPVLADELLQGLKKAGLTLAGLIPGNHDRGIENLGNQVPICTGGVQLGSWRIVHGNEEIPDGNVVLGHFHPCLRWYDGLKGPCYLVEESRIILPAFSEDAAGVNVLGARQWDPYRCCVIAGSKVLDFGTVGQLHRKRINPFARGMR